MDNSIRFYQSLADDYDLMTRFESRLPHEREVLKRIVERFQIDCVVDVACGSGLHAVALAQLGLRVVGADNSGAMIEKAKENAGRHDVHVDWMLSPMQDLNQHVTGEYSAVFCLGNSIPHLLTRDDLMLTLAGFYRLLRTNGVVMLQLLNYERILNLRERIVGIHRSGTKEFIRFYDFEEPLVSFNILTVDWSGDSPLHELQTTELYPYRSAELKTAISGAKFAEPECHADMTFTPFDSRSSVNLIITARKR